MSRRLHDPEGRVPEQSRQVMNVRGSLVLTAPTISGHDVGYSCRTLRAGLRSGGGLEIMGRAPRADLRCASGTGHACGPRGRDAKLQSRLDPRRRGVGARPDARAERPHCGAPGHRPCPDPVLPARHQRDPDGPGASPDRPFRLRHLRPGSAGFRRGVGRGRHQHPRSPGRSRPPQRADRQPARQRVQHRARSGGADLRLLSVRGGGRLQRPDDPARGGHRPGGGLALRHRAPEPLGRCRRHGAPHQPRRQDVHPGQSGCQGSGPGDDLCPVRPVAGDAVPPVRGR